MIETGPIYGTPLIKTLAIGTGGFLQACPSRADLEQVAIRNQRTAAAYEVLLGHYQRLQEEIERLEQENRELRALLVDEVVADPISAVVVAIGEAADPADEIIDEEDEYDDWEDEYDDWEDEEWSTDE